MPAVRRPGEYFQEFTERTNTLLYSLAREREPSRRADAAQPVLAHGFGLLDETFDIADGAMEA